MLTVFGSINVDQVIHVPSIPLPGETILGQRALTTQGGKGANQAVAAARAGTGEVPVTMVGAVGEDDFGRRAIKNFVQNSVLTEITNLPNCATGTAYITLSQDGENAITVVPGANDHVTSGSISSDLLANTRVLLCQGEVALNETVATMNAFRKRRPNGVILLNLAPVPAEADDDLLRAALTLSDALIVNELEAEAICALLATEQHDELTNLAAQHDCAIVVTRGADGAELITSIGTEARATSPKIYPVDTTGAGDTFCGVLAMLLAEGAEIKPAMHAACAAAALACGVVGAQTGMPYRSEFLNNTDPL